ncbi:MAG: DUF898 family protein [Pseudomonadota bacterium]
MEQTVEQPGTRPVRPSYAKDGPSLVWLAIWTAALTILTLGLYRFWMTTRLRRHYWAAIRIEGDPLEYAGTGLEKLLGFLLALVILAVYLTLVNLGLAFLGLAQFEDPLALQAALNLSIVASLPLIFFATYRARRYILSRTRWRGVRFGMDQAAWGYTGRALLYVLATVLSAGLLYPLQHFRLIKFKTDRTWFGSLAFHQHGTWRALLWAWVLVYLGVLILASGAYLLATTGTAEAPNPNAMGVLALGYLVTMGLMVRYQVQAFRYFWDHRSLGEAWFTSALTTRRVLVIQLIGYLAIAGIVLLIGAGVIALVFGIWAVLAGASLQEAAMAVESGDRGRLAWPIFIAIGFSYLVMIAAASALTQVFLARPLLRAYVDTMDIHDAGSLAESQQRAHDEALEAGGFADALGVDVGAGV